MQREERMWWAVIEGEVVYTEGDSCWDDPNSYYCPEFESTLRVGHHLFETEKEALSRAIKIVEGDINNLQARLFQLRDRYDKIKGGIQYE